MQSGALLRVASLPSGGLRNDIIVMKENNEHTDLYIRFNRESRPHRTAQSYPSRRQHAAATWQLTTENQGKSVALLLVLAPSAATGSSL